MKFLKNRFFAVLLLSISTTLFFSQCKDDDEPAVEICGNGIDDDNNGFTDAADLACQENGSECTNGIDDDNDGFTDAEDSDCQ